MSIRTKAVSTLIGLSALMPANAQKSACVISQQKPLVEVVQKPVKKRTKIIDDISLRTFQFLNGNNFTAVGTGIGWNKGKTSAYISPLAGYALFQTYNTNLFKRGWQNNVGINGGLVYSFK